MLQLILHLSGDYIAQTDWMARNKSKMSGIGYLSCYLHCLIYSLPFALVFHSIIIFLIVFISHFMIDKFSLAKKYMRIAGIGQDRPPNCMLTVVIDNSFHLISNYLTIMYLS